MKFKGPKDFSIFIENKADFDKTTRYEAVVNYCESEDVDIDDISDLLNKNLRDKIKEECISLNLIHGQKKKTSIFPENNA